MLALIYALVAAVAVGVAAAFVPFVGPIGAPLPALVAGAAVYLLLVRRVNARLQGEMAGIQALLMQKNIDGALATLEGIKRRFGRWVFLLASQIDGQIGAILYMKRDFDAARPYLERAFVRNWDAKLMLACLLSGQVTDKKGKERRADLPAVDKLLDRVVRYTPKQGLLWSTWAWLHWSAGNTTRALEILARGKQALGETDPHLSANMLALQNDKKLKMKGYGDSWYAFHLEQHPMALQAQRGNVRFARR
jgi:tetratricopeptide (TPR) repeat protein